MNTSEIAKEICKFVKENLVAAGIEIKPETSLTALGLDSFSIIEIVLFLERKFGIELPDEALTPENIASPNAMAACAVSYK